MLRRTLLRSSLSALGLGAIPLAKRAAAELRKMKITRVRLFESPITRPMINQSHHIVTVETDAGLTGIGEGGSADLINDCAVHLIGTSHDPKDFSWFAQELPLLCRTYPVDPCQKSGKLF